MGGDLGVAVGLGVALSPAVQSVLRIDPHEADILGGDVDIGLVAGRRRGMQQEDAAVGHVHVAPRHSQHRDYRRRPTVMVAARTLWRPSRFARRDPPRPSVRAPADLSGRQEDRFADRVLIKQFVRRLGIFQREAVGQELVER